MFDYRGYGGSTGTATLDAILGDGLLIYDRVRAMPSIAGKPIVVHGRSLGSFVSGNIANQRTLSALVLESSATTAEEWVQERVDNSFWIRKGIAGSTLKGRGNSSVMASLDEPLLIVVGKGRYDNEARDVRGSLQTSSRTGELERAVNRFWRRPQWRSEKCRFQERLFAAT